ncbi:hypothetical protein DPMN_046900 [Dreissena polymorpha]|uniref:Adenosine deaminase n=1 Tax=Dreissena polymorpha TaxID=45954 RepID=A0A9D4D8S0_DREPO|nr:hypothetical protein DPMN_046900 [Dreissena polymorpha]
MPNKVCGFKRRSFVRRFVKDGVSYSINTDDPVVLGNILTDDFKFAGDMGLTDEEIIRGIFNARPFLFCVVRRKEENSPRAKTSIR